MPSFSHESTGGQSQAFAGSCHHTCVSAEAPSLSPFWRAAPHTLQTQAVSSGFQGQSECLSSFRLPWRLTQFSLGSPSWQHIRSSQDGWPAGCPSSLLWWPNAHCAEDPNASPTELTSAGCQRQLPDLPCVLCYWASTVFPTPGA